MQHLVSVSVIGSHDDLTDESLSSAVHEEMSQWFGDKQTADWKLLKVYRVSFAQPNQVTYSPHAPSECWKGVIIIIIILNQVT